MRTERLDTRGSLLLDALKIVEIKRTNRRKGDERNDEKAKAAAAAMRPKRLEASRARRKAWKAWRKRRELARRQAKRGLYVLPPATHGPGTRACCACGVPQPATSFAETCEPCNSCTPQVAALDAALAAQRAARARARKRLRPSQFGVWGATAGRTEAEL